MKLCMAMVSTAICSAVIGTAPPGQDGTVLDDGSYAQWRHYLHPTEDDLCWRTIPWRETFQQSVQDAQAEGKPIILWAMNGHPLACV